MKDGAGGRAARHGPQPRGRDLVDKQGRGRAHALDGCATEEVLDGRTARPIPDTAEQIDRFAKQR